MSEELIPFTIRDTILMFNIINTSAKRGVFQPGEFENIGTLYNKIRSHLQPFFDQQNKNSRLKTRTAATTVTVAALNQAVHRNNIEKKAISIQAVARGFLSRNKNKEN